MVKICFLTTISATLKAFVMDFAKYLHETGKFEVYFICDNDEDFAKSLPEYVHYIPVPMKRGINLSSFKAIGKLRKIFKEYQFDIVQYSTPNAAYYGSIAAKQAKVPVRLYCQWGLAYVAFSGLKRALFKNIEKSVCRRSTWILPDSHGNLEFCQKEKLYTDKKSSVVWNGSASGVNLTKFDISHKEEWRKEIRARYNIPADAFVYIFIGRITRDKGINELFSASRSILAEKLNAYVFMVGSNEVQTGVDEEGYTWSKTEERVVYTGHTDEVEKFISASDVYILPSYREGFGSAIVEAEAMGVPVIVTDIPGPINAMLDGKTGLVVKKADAISLEQAMRRMIEDSPMREQMSKDAYSFAVEKFEQKQLFSKMYDERMRLLGKE